MIHLFAAMMDAPLVAVSKRWPNTTHAVTMEALAEGWERGTFAAACGKRRLRLMGTRDGIGALWPPRVKGASIPRCRECWVATGKGAPRTEWRTVDDRA